MIIKQDMVFMKVFLLKVRLDDSSQQMFKNESLIIPKNTEKVRVNAPLKISSFSIAFISKYNLNK